ncbi:MAG: hypothetical protein DRJ40_06535 [Thermoprotei archaeon]|nr:MAG: hypothetical protein DRJ40_06535 [Thermoprotei archaeon]
MIEDYKKYFIDMVYDVRNFIRSRGIEVYFTGRAARVREALVNDPYIALFAILSMPSDDSRKMGLENLRRWIHQLWVIVKVCEFLGLRKSEKWYIGQSWAEGTVPLARVETEKLGPLSIWFEAQIHIPRHSREVPIAGSSRCGTLNDLSKVLST